ncbi:MAG TPA: energy transducer TonB [Candidatus Binatia bacterium]|nr:energy transducer TonB [Candidatus Binatia bacterium]
MSRPCRVAPIVRRAWGFALAVGLYGAILLGILASPVFMLELMKPPHAGVTPPAPRGKLVFHSGGHKGGNRLPPGAIRQGEKDGKGGRSERARTTRPRPATTLVPLAEPQTPAEPSEDTTENPDGPPGPGGPPGDPGGHGDQQTGVIDGGCKGCTGPGLDGPGEDGPFGPSTPGLIPPRIIPSSRALPQYPAAARRAGLLGTVILMIVVDADGSVGQIEVLRSPDQRWGFDLSAIDAVKQWRYEPALMNGKAVAAYITVMVEFTLSR